MNLNVKHKIIKLLEKKKETGENLQNLELSKEL